MPQQPPVAPNSGTRDALPLIDRRSEDAAIEAGVRADELLAEGDVDGAATWRAIILAIEELQRAKGR